MLPRAAAVLSMSGPEKVCPSSSPSSTSRLSSPPSCWRNRSETACSCRRTVLTHLVYVYAAVPLACRSSCRSTRGAGPLRLAGGDRWHAAVLQRQRHWRFWYAFRLAPVLAAAGHLLCVGQLLRHYRAGPGVELRELAVRHAAGEAAVRPDRLGRLARRDHRRDPGAVSRRARGRRRSTCCSFSPASS